MAGQKPKTVKIITDTNTIFSFFLNNYYSLEPVLFNLGNVLKFLGSSFIILPEYLLAKYLKTTRYAEEATFIFLKSTMSSHQFVPGSK